jgi:hypothetical protein
MLLFHIFNKQFTINAGASWSDKEKDMMEGQKNVPGGFYSCAKVGLFAAGGNYFPFVQISTICGSIMR